MNLIFGGAYQGKLEYAKRQFTIDSVFTCSSQKAELDFAADAIDHLEDFALACVRQGLEAKAYLDQHRDEWRGKVMICNDLSQGIVPMEPELRELREMTGRMMIYLASCAESVTRVFCGLPQVIKEAVK